MDYNLSIMIFSQEIHTFNLIYSYIFIFSYSYPLTDLSISDLLHMDFPSVLFAHQRSSLFISPRKIYGISNKNIWCPS